MTQEPIEVNRNIDCEIYAGSYRRLAGAPAPRFYLTLALDAVTYSSLCALLGANLKGAAVVHFTNIQAPLPDEDDEATRSPYADQRPLTPPQEIEEARMSVDGLDNQRVRRPRRARAAKEDEKPSSGIVPHAYTADIDQPGFCLYCKQSEGNELHNLTPAAEEAEDQERCEAMFGDDNEVCLLDKGHEGLHSTYTHPELTEEQVEARERLAATAALN